MNTDKNSYTIIYASIMVVVAAILLAGAATVLRPAQQENERVDKMQQILRSVGQTPAAAEVGNTYKATITAELLVNEAGDVLNTFSGDQLTDNEAFKLNTEFAFKSKDYSRLPVYLAKMGDKDAIILPMNGAGLWGPIWGFISIDAADRSTVLGVDFGNKGETPGLGAEISTADFANLFVGKQIFKEGTFKSIAVVKKGTKLADQDYVDGISGGTLTSDGVHAMIENSLAPYQNFLTKYNAQ